VPGERFTEKCCIEPLNGELLLSLLNGYYYYYYYYDDDDDDEDDNVRNDYDGS